MAEFSAAAELSVTLAQGQAQSIRSELERELSNVEVGVGRGGGAAPVAIPDGGGSSGLGQRAGILDASRQTLDATESLLELAQERNQFLEDLADGGVGGGGGGGARAGLAGGLAARGLGGVAAGAAGTVGAVGLGGVGLLGALGAAAVFGDEDLRNQDEEQGGPGPNPPGPPGGGEPEFGQRFPGVPRELVADPAGRQPRNVPDRSPLAGGRIDNTLNVETQISVDALQFDERRLRELVERRDRTLKRDIVEELKREFGVDLAASRVAGPTTSTGL